MRGLFAAFLLVVLAAAMPSQALIGHDAMPTVGAGPATGSWNSAVSAIDQAVASQLRSGQLGAGVPTTLTIPIGATELAFGIEDGTMFLRQATYQDVQGLASPDFCVTMNDVGAPVPTNPAIHANCKETLGKNAGIPRGFMFVTATEAFAQGELSTWVNYTNGAKIWFHCVHASGSVVVGISPVQGSITCDPLGSSGTYGLFDSWKMEGAINSKLTGVVTHVVY